MLSGTLRLGDLELPWTATEVEHRRRVAVVQAPGVPGQLVEDLGRGGYQLVAHMVLSGDGWEERFDALLGRFDSDPAVDVVEASGRTWHGVIVGVREQWRHVDGVALDLEVVEDSNVDTVVMPSASAAASSALRPWPAAAAAAAALEDLLSDTSPPTLGELAAQYRAVAAACDAAAAAYDATTEDGAEAQMTICIAQAAALQSLSVAVRELL